MGRGRDMVYWICRMYHKDGIDACRTGEDKRELARKGEMIPVNLSKIEKSVGEKRKRFSAEKESNGSLMIENSSTFRLGGDT